MGLIGAVAVALLAIASQFIVSFLVGGRAAQLGSPAFEFADIPELAGTYAVVTGANSGVGLVTARELAKKGAHVIATCREEAKGREALADMLAVDSNPWRGRVEFLPLDLSSLQSVKTFASIIVGRQIPVHTLILNAGVMMVPYAETSEGLEWQFGVNHVGHFLLVKLLLGSMRAGARIVHVSSIGHHFTYHPEGIRFDQLNNSAGYNRIQAYAHSKLANILFSNALARRLAGTGITSNAVHPGTVDTGLYRHIDPFASASSRALNAMKYYLMAYVCLFMDMDMGAKTQVHVAVSPALEGVTGRYFTPIGKDSAPSAHAADIDLQERLWTVSEALVEPFMRA